MTGDIVQNMISELGQSQSDRRPKELEPDFVQIDERTPLDLLRFVKEFAGFVAHYPRHGRNRENWKPFFDYAEDRARALIEHSDGTTPPHLALLVAFAKIYESSRSVLNDVTQAHLKFFYERVLGFAPRAVAPDRAHVLFELKKNAASVAVKPSHLLSGGKDAQKLELVYAPVRETVVSGAKIERTCSVFVDSRARGAVRFAPVADSADGVGTPLPEAQPVWAPFGHENLPFGELGFAFAAPVLRMREGQRKVKLSVTTGAGSLTVPSGTALAAAFQAFVTGEKGWLGPYALTGTRMGDLLELELVVPATDPPVVDYDTVLHGFAYVAEAPVIQVLLRGSDTKVGYEGVRGLTIRRARLSVEVSGLTSLKLESDLGPLDSKKVFLPFGPQPVGGARFMIESSEALSKDLTELALSIHWHGLPADLGAHYRNYGSTTYDKGYFTALVAFRDGAGDTTSQTGVRLLDAVEGKTAITISPGARSGAGIQKPLAIDRVRALRLGGTAWTRKAALRVERASPVLSFARAATEPRAGFITISLEKDLLHELYRQKTIESIVNSSKPGGGTLVVLNEPYTPAIRSVSLSYKARSAELDVETASLDKFSDSDVQFFHVDCFGQRREHAYLRQQLPFVTDKHVPLLPSHPHEGELLLAMSGIHAGDSVSLLFQVAEGSADPDVDPPLIEWFVLCDNHWKPLAVDELVLDTTNRMLTSGVIAVVVPEEATTDNTLMAPGCVSLKAAVSRRAAATSRLFKVAPNAVEVALQAPDQHGTHLAAALPASKIVKLKTPIASVKAVTQPYASFGGSPVEVQQAVQTRAAERLRHKDRCITPWDYERIVLGAFPRVHRVKCIPHAKPGAWLAPGHVLVIVVPDLRNDNARNPLEPKVDANTVVQIEAHLRKRAGMHVEVAVKNPRYQKIRVEFKVRFATGYAFNHYRKELERELVAFLSPWAYDATRPIYFGGRVYRSVLLDFVEERPYVDYVTDFRMYSYTGTRAEAADLAEVQPEAPDTILVSDAEHDITEAP